eukprot:82345_1
MTEQQQLHLKVGDRVETSDNLRGTVKYIGYVSELGNGIFVGIELDEYIESGNDGSITINDDDDNIIINAESEDSEDSERSNNNNNKHQQKNNNVRYFDCDNGYGIFVVIEECKKVINNISSS